EEHEQGRSDVRHERLAHRLHAEALVRTQTGGRKLLLEFLGGQREARLGLLERHAVLEPSGGLKIVPLIAAVRIELERYVHLGHRSEILGMIVGTDDADHGVDVAAERNRLADDVGIAAEAAGPESLADERDMRPARQ